VALGEIADRLRKIEAAAGAHTVLNAHYTGTFSLLAYFFPLRFFHRLGATEVDPDTICNKAGHVALDYVYGTSMAGFDPRTARDAACILVWGANPSASAPHAHDHWLPESAAQVVVVDPVKTPTAAAADLHLQRSPGATPPSRSCSSTSSTARASSTATSWPRTRPGGTSSSRRSLSARRTGAKP
jgi:anaerobic selenocysteine-containing dehydrogenase